jgi:hypothetical protein
LDLGLWVGRAGVHKSFIHWNSRGCEKFGGEMGDLLSDLEDIFQILSLGVS